MTTLSLHLSTGRRHSQAFTPSGIHSHLASTKSTSSALSPIDASEFAPRRIYYRPLSSKDLRKLLLQNGYPQGVITFNINDVLNKNKNKSNNLVQATVPKKDILIVLPYLGLHSNQVTKRLKSWLFRQSQDHIPKQTPHQLLFSIQRSLEPISEVQGRL